MEPIYSAKSSTRGGGELSSVYREYASKRSSPLANADPERMITTDARHQRFNQAGASGKSRFGGKTHKLSLICDSTRLGYENSNLRFNICIRKPSHEEGNEFHLKGSQHLQIPEAKHSGNSANMKHRFKLMSLMTTSLEEKQTSLGSTGKSSIARLYSLLPRVSELVAQYPEYDFKPTKQKEPLSQDSNGKKRLSENAQNLLARLKQVDWSRVSVAEFTDLAIKSEESSTALQVLITESDLNPSLEGLLVDVQGLLATKRLGCHLLSTGIQVSSKLRESLLSVSAHQLVTYSRWASSSKVLQILASMSEDFSKKFILTFCSNWPIMSTNISAIFLLSSCLATVSCSDPGFELVGRYLSIESSKARFSRHNKRILVNFLQYCSKSCLDEFYEILGFETRFIERMDDKYMVYIFSVFLARGYQKATVLMTSAFKMMQAGLFNTCFFRLLLVRIFKNPGLENLQSDIRSELTVLLKELLRYKQVSAKNSLLNICFILKLLLATLPATADFDIDDQTSSAIVRFISIEANKIS
jgi:hypothetical protein